MDEDDEEDLGARRARPDRYDGQRRLAGGGGILARLKTGMPALFPPPPPADLPGQLQLLLEMRTQRLRRFLIRALIFVGLPCVLVAIYTTLIATKRYVSTFQVTYQVYQPVTSLSGGLQPATPSTQDAIDYGTVIVEYVSSEALALLLDQQLHLRAYFSGSKIDWTSRLSRNATDAQYFSYYGNRVSASEGFGGYVTITVQAFDPAFTLKLAQTIDSDTNAMLNGIAGQARQAEVASATSALSAASAQLDQANAALTAYRNAHGDLDPTQIATELGSIEGALDSQLATVKAQLAQALANMQPNNPQIVQLNLQIQALQQQIDAERGRLASGDGQANYSSVVAEYQTLLSKQQLALTNYQAAQQGLLAAQSDAAREQYYVVDFVAPALPDRPTAPDPLIDTGETFLACIVGYSIVNLLYSALRDQTGV